jgi:hypothetical protein
VFTSGVYDQPWSNHLCLYKRGGNKAKKPSNILPYNQSISRAVLVHKIMATNYYSDGTASNDDGTCMFALKLLGGFMEPFTIKADAELGLMDQLLATEHAMTATSWWHGCRVLPWRPPRWTAFSGFLASHSEVQCDTEVRSDGKSCRSYAAGPVCKWFTQNGVESWTWTRLSWECGTCT